MRRLIAKRLGGTCPDAGAYAILYAVLAVVLLGMCAIVIDFAGVRQDRRLDRSTTDSAVIAGAEKLNPQNGNGSSPYDACLTAWKYIIKGLNLTSPYAPPLNACANFAPYQNNTQVSAYCSSNGGQPAEIPDQRTISNGRVVKIAWPIPYHVTGAKSDFLVPDLSPGRPAQDFNVDVDGAAAGCERLGVAIFEDEDFGLGVGIGASRTHTQVHSVARFNPAGGPSEGVAALNVLDVDGCESLVKTGNGYIYVWPTIDSSTSPPAVVGPGSISVESTGAGCNGGKAVIEVKGGTGQICAMLSDVTACDGKGVIQEYSAGASFAYDAGSGTIKPTPIPAAFQQHWNPLTGIYGCHAADFSGSPLPSGTFTCSTPANHNYVEDLITAYGGGGTPTVYNAQPPYVNPYPSPFVSRNDVCSVGAGTTLVVPPGNWYANCGSDMQIDGTLVVQGGNLVVKKGLVVNGCFVMNSAVNTCATATSGSGALITTATPPTSDSIVFLRAGGFSTSNTGTVVMPQTFVYGQKSGGGPLQFRSANAAAPPLWTAPGAGAINSGRTTLEQACFDSSINAPNPDCMASRFSRMAYWSDFAAPKSPASSSNTFNGQGQLAYVGVFFTPLAYVNLTGGSTGKAALAQFWGYDLDINGGATLELRPDVRFAIAIQLGQAALIR